MSPRTTRTGRLGAENRSLRNAIHLLHRVADLVTAEPELEPTCYALLTGVTAGVGLGLNRAMLFMTDPEDRGRLRGAAAVGPADRDEADRVWRSIEAEGPDLATLYEVGLHLRDDHPGALDRIVRATTVPIRGRSPVARCMRRGDVVFAEGDDDLDGLLHLPTTVAAPLRGRRSVHGVLVADNRFTEELPDEVARLVFGLLADHAGSAIEAAHEYERVAAEARTDALTQLRHHGSLMDDLARAVREAAASGTPLGLAMIDLDDFKSVNDTLGHLAGDALLAGVAARMRDVVRAGETPYRYGGEEFAVVLPGAGADAAARVGERVRRAVGDHPFPIGEGNGLRVTCSVGVASLPADAHDAQSLVAVADAALLEAKAAGKDRVISAAARR